jgi:hypothetical protein
MSEHLFTNLRNMGCVIEPCGSRVTCDPPVMNTDADYLIECPSAEAAVSAVVNDLSSAGYQWEGSSNHYQSCAVVGFMSWRKDDTNLIVTANPDFAKRHRIATALCARLNLMKKADRIAVFQAVLYGKTQANDAHAASRAAIAKTEGSSG